MERACETGQNWTELDKNRTKCHDASKGKSDRLGDYSTIVFLGIGRDKLLDVDAVLDHILMDQLVRKTIVFCEQKRPKMAGIEAEQFQELLVHEGNGGLRTASNPQERVTLFWTGSRNAP